MNRNDLTSALVKILKGVEVIGTGFVVSQSLVATSAHVVEEAGAAPGRRVRVRFLATESKELVEALVVPEFWRASDAEDLAFLRIDVPLPAGVRPVEIGESTDIENRKLCGYGFPEGEGNGLWADVNALGRLRDEYRIQLQSQEISPGYSGGPLLDEARGKVVAMIQAIRPSDPSTGRHTATAFATRVEALRTACPELLTPAPLASAAARPDTIHIFLGEAGFDGGPGAIAVGVVLLEDPSRLTNALENAREDLLHDQALLEIPGVEDRLRRRGFRYRDDDRDVRARFVEILKGQLFEAYVCCAPRKFFGEKPEQLVFEQLLEGVLADRLRRHASRIVFIHATSGTRTKALPGVVSAMASQIGMKRQIRKDAPALREHEVSLVERAEACHWVTDYVCEIVKARVDAADPRDSREFESIRDKVRLVRRLDTNRFFSRKAPLP
ncbi:S1 family peptidase [Polyangium fumosum]|uniref:Serine protease n=1 Tax=Polyangium fumosum TaxID=889272 RepID=A0A4U1JDA5_9BACT|nr:serine protease [Polyangium fumosum]TKD08433.1 serine protease [Polyangium fumosum]